MSSSFSFFKDLKFLSYRSFTCLVIQRYIICDCCEGHCLPNSFFSPFNNCIKAGYWFFKLVFYPATLLKMFISYQISLKNIWTHKHMLLYNLWIAILWLPLFQFISYFFSMPCIPDLSKSFNIICWILSKSFSIACNFFPWCVYMVDYIHAFFGGGVKTVFLM